MYTMTDICLVVYYLPHVSLCGFIRYFIKYKFATNNDSGVPQTLIYFTIGTLRLTKVSNVANNVVNDTRYVTHDKHADM